MFSFFTKVPLVILFFICEVAHAQLAYNSAPIIPSITLQHSDADNYEMIMAGRKLFQRNTGMILGLQKGKYTSIELGGEAHWRKISLLKPHIVGATANLEYNFSNNVIGYKAGMWMKRGRVNLTYGANVGYFTNFNEGHRFSIGPAVGFRLLGLHLINGYNFLTKDKTNADEAPIEVNSLYMSLRYYFPVHNTFTWGRKTMKKKKERRSERAKRKKERAKKKDNEESKGLFDFLKPKKKNQ